MTLTPLEAKKKIPLSPFLHNQIEKQRNTVRSIIAGKDPRLLLVIGPCSIHNEESALHYAENLAQLRHEISDHFFVVMRSYLEKPRTKHGWKGFITDPNLNNASDIEAGILRSRALLKSLIEKDIALATEFVDPFICPYYEEFISWGSIGARTVTSPVHRQLASMLSMPIGCKNSLDGSIEHALFAIDAARKPQSFLALNEKGAITITKSSGNSACHLVLRGGSSGPNYSDDALFFAEDALSKLQLKTGIIIDASHDNSMKNPHLQPDVFFSALRSAKKESSLVKGIMVESFLEEGKQKEDTHQIAKDISYTDACLGWHATEALLREAIQFLQKDVSICVK